MQTDGHSLDAQLAACRKLCADRGWTIVSAYSDVESARTTDRPQFRAMLLAAEVHAFDVIVVHKLDRFSRSVTDTLSTLRRLAVINVGLVSISEQFDFTTPAGKVMLTMLSAFAEWYVDNLSTEVAKGKRARAAKGQWNSMLPYGYTCTYRKDGGDGAPIVRTDEGAGVLSAFTWFATGHYSDLEIAGMLNRAGYRPHGRGQRALPLWSKDSIRYLLTNRFYVGEVQYQGQWQPGQHEPIIDRALFDRCQQIRAGRGDRHSLTAKAHDRTYPLSGLARCARCGARMRGHSSSVGHRVRYYRDPSRERGGACPQRSVRAQEAEDALAAYLSTLRLPDEWREKVMANLHSRFQAGNSEQDKIRLQQQMERYRTLFVLGDITEEEYKSRRQELKRQLDALTPPAMPDLEQAAQLLDNIGNIWQRANDDERHKLLHAMLEAVYLDSEAGPVVGIVPKPDLAPLFSVMSHTGTTGVTPACDIILFLPGLIVALPLV